MPKADTIPNTIVLTHQFEELALFWQFTAGIPFRGARIDGEFELTFHTDDGDWWISDLWIQADNGRVGKEAEGRLLNLNADTDERLYLLVLDALDHQYGFRIEDWIQDELAEAGLRRRAA